MGNSKNTLRTRASHLRDSLSASEIILKSRRIQETVLRFPPYLRSRAVALYSPTGNEVATEEIREHALKTGKKLFYPKLGAEADLRLVQVKGQGDLRPGRYGILEPTGDRIMTKQDEEGLVVLVPGLAFDLSGNRLGRGKGWYDRVIAALGEGVRLVALAFEFQIVEELPAEMWDQKVHHIITERRVVDCGNLPSESGWVS